MAEKYYIIVGNGFVPGLPARVSMNEAKSMGMDVELQAAIERGNYVAESVPAVSSPAVESKAGDKKGVTNG